MNSRTTFWAARLSLRQRPHIHSRSRRLLSTKPDHLKPETSQKLRSRITRFNSQLPKFLQGYTTPLIHAPITHVSSFLFLHEMTAIAPLVGLTAIFHYTQWTPRFMSEGKWVADGVEKFGNYFRKKGWLGEEEKTRRHRWWKRGEGGTRLLAEVGTAYALTKVLLPLRIVASVWATPWFARVAIVPMTTTFTRWLSKRGAK